MWNGSSNIHYIFYWFLALLLLEAVEAMEVTFNQIQGSWVKCYITSGTCWKPRTIFEFIRTYWYMKFWALLNHLLKVSWYWIVLLVPSNLQKKQWNFFPGFLPYPLKRGKIKKTRALYTTICRILFWLAYTTFLIWLGQKSWKKFRWFFGRFEDIKMTF